MLPPVVESIDQQTTRCLTRLRTRQGGDLEKYEYLAALKWNDRHLFYRLLIDHIKV